MKKLIAIAVSLLCACVVFAKPQKRTITVTLGDHLVAGTNQTADIYGYIDEILVSCSDGSSTGVVVISAAPVAHTGNTLSAVTLATATVTDEKLFRPRVDGTTTAGADNTNDPPGKFMVYKETVTMLVTASESTNVNWRAVIKYDDGK